MEPHRHLWLLLLLVGCGHRFSRTDGSRDAGTTRVTLDCPPDTRLEKQVSPDGTASFCARVLGGNPTVDVQPAQARFGPTVEQYPGGGIRARGEYENDARHGSWTYFDTSGAKVGEGSFVRGRRTGRWIQWARGGNVRTEVEYVEGDLEGPWRNVRGLQTLGEGAFAKGLATGAWVSHVCGSNAVRQTLTYDAGKLEGPCHRVDVDGAYLDGSYRADKKDGRWTQVLRSGARFESVWRSDVRDGPWRWVSAEGHPVLEGSLVLGKLDGEWSVFDAEGVRAKQGVYRAGALVSGSDVVSVPRLNGYESNAYCTDNAPGFVPLPRIGDPPTGIPDAEATRVCASW